MYKNPLTEEQMSGIFAANLRYLRKCRDWPLSQTALAKILHVSRKTIINYESGSASLSAYVVYDIAAYFNCTMEELLTKRLYEERMKQL